MATKTESAKTEIKEMNPPSALHGAMSRERKPFTYTPGGLDLSEIKSERMAKRLMRNAMNQGVPELPPPAINSPTTPTTPIVVPNFNCLPVQVFPTINLPANPKSLLRTRSTPDPQKANTNMPQSFISIQPKPSSYQPSFPSIPQQSANNRLSGIENIRDTLISNISNQENKISNNYRPFSFCETNTETSNNEQVNQNSYGKDYYSTAPLPEISYDAEICHVTGINNNQPNICLENKHPGSDLSELVHKPLPITVFEPAPVSKPVEEITGTCGDEQKEVKVVKKQVKKEKKAENGDHNGDDSGETEMTVKLPVKKSAAKTETKVEVVKKVLPDGSIEEIKTTTTKTTIDGKTQIKTQTETTIFPKEEEEEEEIEEIEEEEEEEEEVEENGVEEEVKEPIKETITKIVTETNKPKDTTKIGKEVEKSETTTNKVIIVQESNKDDQESEEEGEEEIEEEVEEEVVIVNSVQAEKPQTPPNEEEVEDEEQEKEEEEETGDEEPKEHQEDKSLSIKQEKEEVVDENMVTVTISENQATEKPEEEEEVEEEKQYEKAKEPEEIPAPSESKPSEPAKQTDEVKEEETPKQNEQKIEKEKEVLIKVSVEQNTEVKTEELLKESTAEEPKKEEPQPTPSEQKLPLREPSIPLEKVEEVEIKPIGLVSKTHSESTEIKSSISDKPTGSLSTQTEYNRIENVVTVNRTTKTLDHSYEQISQQGIPIVKTYFAPERERVSTSPQPSRPYQTSYPPPLPTERRHSLLLERLSTERQMPSNMYQDSYQSNNQTQEQQRQWSQEPQAEIINVSNVKPSTITNQQWYQQSRKENVLYNNLTTPATPAQPCWSQPSQQPQPQVQPQQQYQPSLQSQPQQQYQPPTQSYPQSQYQSPYLEQTQSYQQNNFSGYSPKSSNWATNNLTGTVNSQTNQYTYLNTDSSESYQKSSQQYSTSYVPPPWEQDASYVAPEIQYIPPSSTTSTTKTSSPNTKQGWKPTPPAPKFSKTGTTSYVPPAPNQSFVKPVNTTVEPPKLPGRKTYYSEYERRYITVPESTYIPTERKYQPQPDPSPQYYYDNNEPAESVEPEWRKELREFTEKTSQTQQTIEQTSIRPPWEEDPKYAKVPTVTYNPTPSWSQSLRPQSYRERSFESEFVELKDWSKTNTLGRGRPLSSYGNSNELASAERQRGVSVDRYNPNSYRSPVTTEHAPVQTHLHNPTAASQAKAYHNPNVPAYHARASAEPREQPVIPTPRQWGNQHERTTPIQSRSFKYLQWITGTED